MSKELNYLLSLLKGAAVLKGGALRAAMGKIVEDFTEYIWNEVAKEFPTLDSFSVAQDTLSYFMTRKNINKVFFLSNIKRCSMPDKHISRNPEWILEEKITELVNFIKQIYEEENKNATTTRCKRC